MSASTRSFEQINYELRPNKQVERKLVVDVLAQLGRTLDIQRYRYVGFGSMWFADFILLHKRLNLTKMISIEIDGARKDRAEFNKPYECVEVIIGDSHTVLPSLSWEEPSVVWLDYDTPPDADILDDLAFLATRLSPGSVFIVTLNAQPPALSEEHERRVEQLRDVWGAALPIDITQAQLSNRQFPSVLAEAGWAHLRHARKHAAVAGSLKPIFSLAYRDGATMLTLSGIVTDDGIEAKLSFLNLAEEIGFASGEELFWIEVPPLTVGEKRRLDRFMPCVDLPSSADLGFTLPEKQIRAYSKLYRYYPVYREVEQ